MRALNPNNFSQVGIVVKDIEQAGENFAELFGCEVPPSNPGGTPAAEAHYHGLPAPEAKCKLAFMDLTPGVQLELIEPNEGMSTWREFLNKHGEGIHHIAFKVENTMETITACETLGMKVVQEGYYEDRSGRYTYLDGGEITKCIIELLEDF